MKLTKTEKRLGFMDHARRILGQAIKDGYRPWRRGDRINFSDRYYIVEANGQWRRHEYEYKTA